MIEEREWSEISNTDDDWEFLVEDFECEVHPLFDLGEGEFRVSGLPLWNRDCEGIVEARTPVDLLTGITVDSEWRLQYRLASGEDHVIFLECRLYHHDRPTGGYFTVRAIPESERVERWER